MRTKAAIAVNRELLSFYWELGNEIIEKQTSANWGSRFLQNLSKDLITQFPDIKGFSYRNLRRVRQWVIFYSSEESKLATACDQFTANEPKTTKQTQSKEVTNLATACGQFGQQAVAQLPAAIIASITSIPWGHNIAIITKCSSHAEALYYVRQTSVHGWSRSVLLHQIESDLFAREGSATSNFATTLPPAQSDLAQQTLKDPYVFDFLTLTKAHNF